MFFLSLAPLLLFPSISSADRQRLPRLPVVKESLAGVNNTNATPHARRLISNPNICCFAFTSTFSEGIKTLYIVVLYTYHGSIERATVPLLQDLKKIMVGMPEVWFPNN